MRAAGELFVGVLAVSAATVCLVGCGGGSRALTPAEIAQRVNPAVVSIKAGNASGTGFIVAKDGRIATNLHVVAGNGSAITVTFDDKKVLPVVEVLGFSAKYDLAVLRVDASALPTVPLGDSGRVHVGDPVVAIGNPLGLDHTLSNGLVSAVRTHEDVTILQVSAPISPGSSGGPLLDEHGRVIGVTVAMAREGQNLNFAVPVNYLRQLVQNEQRMTPQKFADAITQMAVADVGPDARCDAAHVNVCAVVCLRGQAQACAVVASAYLLGVGGLGQDAPKAAVLYERACRLGHTTSCAVLGALYAEGKGVPVDAMRAVELFRVSCDHGDVLGCDGLAAAYLRGFGTAKNEPLALKLLQDGCDKGHARSCSLLAGAYADGKATHKDTKRAADLWQRACDGGEGDACDALGSVTHDAGKAAVLFQRGCEKKSAAGCGHWGAALIDGRGTARDPDKGANLLRVSCRAGQSFACDKLRGAGGGP